MSAAVVALTDSKFHLQHGPIDCIVEIDASQKECCTAFEAVSEFFPTVLPQLVAIKSNLYQDLNTLDVKPHVTSPIGQHMIDICWPHRAVFVTPMAAVAGCVADALLSCIRTYTPGARRVWVNNGGDISLYLSPGTAMKLGIVDTPDAPELDGVLEIRSQDSVGGVATSGWHGRSFSFGIADAVTVLAVDAANADVAATLIANEVNIDHPAILRRSANELRDETDLNHRRVTVGVGVLDTAHVNIALDAGEACARRFCTYGAIRAVSLRCQGQVRWVGANEMLDRLSTEVIHTR